MPLQIIFRRPETLIAREIELLILELQDAVIAACFFNEFLFDDHPVIIAEGDEVLIERAVEVGAKRYAVGDGINTFNGGWCGLCKGRDVAGIEY